MNFLKESIILILTLATISSCSKVETPKKSVQNLSSDIVKSQLDNNQYKYIELDNKLKVLLISDPSTSKSAASLDVGVGAFHADKNREGLYHFIEHMLFLGTKKYPVAGDYGQFLKKNGGSSNAYTANESTNYFFDIKNDAFPEALDRFSQFFISPSFDKQYVEREKNAVQSEYSSKIKSDFRRIKEAIRQTRNPEHPYSLFSVGDLNTLADRENSSIHNEVLQAYKRHYSANRMSLVVQSNQSLAQLEKLVYERFKEIPNNDLPTPILNNQLLTKEQLASKVHIVPLKEERSLTLFFPISDTGQFIDTKPVALITHFLQHQGKHSLYETLNNKGWVQSIKTHLNDDAAMDSFEVKFELTANGLNNVDSITSDFFSYLYLVSQKGIDESYYNDIKKIAALDFTFKEKTSPIWNVAGLSPLLKIVQPKNVLRTDYQYEQFNAALTQEYIKELVPTNMQQILVAPALKTTKTEKRYNVNYGVEPIPQSTISLWSNKKAESNAELPELNDFIAQDINIKSAEKENDLPLLVFNQPGIKFWHAQDNDFSFPKSQFRLNLHTDVASNNSKNHVLLMLLKNIIEEKLRSYSFDAKLAGLSYEIGISKKGLNLHFKGFNDKQAELIKAVIQAIVSFNVDPQRFAASKEILSIELDNAAFKSPLSQVFDRLNIEFSEDPYEWRALKKALVNVTIGDIKNYSQLFNASVEIEGFNQGNVTQQETKALASYFEEAFQVSRSLIKDSEKNPVLNSFTRDEVLKIDVKSSDSVVVIAYPLSRTIENSSKTLLLGHILQGSFFTELRTKQQLGYSLGISTRIRGGLPSLVFYIQSPKLAPTLLRERIETYLLDQSQVLENMTEEQLEVFKEGLISKLMKSENSLTERNLRLWQQIEDKFVNFDERDQMAKVISNIKLNDLNTIFKQLFYSEKTQKIIVESIGKS